ncbi:hypothetical protein [Azospirillum sp. B510]|uniref:hypothetical protein n=1 Tax=Azospirillum sp. (strain B510) TaxID=137722 RepID=UPI0005AA6596|nr:hypothetical protein [Azospirillum sp. B510]
MTRRSSYKLALAAFAVSFLLCLFSLSWDFYRNHAVNWHAAVLIPIIGTLTLSVARKLKGEP